LLGTVVASALSACAADADTAQLWQASTVDDYVATTCSTEVVMPLSQQITDEVNCLLPGQLVRLDEGDGIVFTGAAVLPYMGEDARTDLLAAAADGGTLEINSVYRTVAQQYLLYRWFQAGRCSITAAAEPGESNHESGRAVDVNNWAERVDVLDAHGWAHTVPGDDVHFDHLATADIRGSDVHAFQRLWNRNHPDDAIDEDGFWGPMTETALRRAPAEGFATGATCGEPEPDPDPDPDPGTGPGSSDPGGDDGLDDDSGGCAAGRGGGGGAALVLVALGLITTRSRARSAGSAARRR